MHIKAQHNWSSYRVSFSIILIVVICLAGCGGGGGGSSGGGAGGASITAPAGVTVTSVYTTQIDLSWAAVTGATGYNVYESNAAGLTVSPANKNNLTPVVAGTAWSFTGLTASTQYYFLVTALNATGESIGSSVVTATTAPPIALPAAPTGLNATAINASQIDLVWTTVTGATGYNMYRSTAANVAIIAGNKITTTPVTSTSYNDTSGLTALTTYYYKVTAVNSAGESLLGSNEVMATTSNTVATTPTITGFSPATGPTGTSVFISGANLGLGVLPVSSVKFGTTDAASVYGAQAGLTATVPASLAIGAYTITVNVGGTQLAVGAFTVTATSTAVMPDLAKKSGCTACHSITFKVVGPAWLDVGIAYSSNGVTTTGVKVSDILAGKTAEEYLIAKVAAGGRGNWGTSLAIASSPYVSDADIKTLVQFVLSLGATAALPAEPTGLNATGMSTSQINLAWTSVTGATGYNVYRSTSANVVISAGNKITATPVTSTSYNDTSGLTALTTYYYKVTAVNSAGESLLGSNEVTANAETAYGLTFSSALTMGGTTTFANSSPIVAGTTNKTFTYIRLTDTTRYVTVGYSAQGGIELITTQVNEGSAVAVPVATFSGGCVIGSGDILDCLNYGIVFDKTAGSISFSNTSMNVSGGSIATFSMSGTLSFPPF